MSNVFAVIVVYNPNVESLRSLINALSTQVSHIVVCNNSSYVIELQNTTSFWFEDNIGIAAAQNEGMLYAFEAGADFVVQFDQDSIPTDNMVEAFLTSYQSLVERGVNVGLIAPRYFLGDQISSCQPKGDLVEVDAAISSGSLISRDAWNQVGKFKSEFFIDLVDHEYCWRMKKHNFKMFMNCTVKMKHHLGDGLVSLGFIKFVNSKPFRSYYQVRNGLCCLTLSYVPLSWKLKFLCKLPLVFLVSFFMPQPFSRIKYIAFGVIDAVTGKMGKLS